MNIVDLIEWSRIRGDNELSVRVFSTIGALVKYIRETGKIFRNTMNGGDGNVVLRHLLRRIF